MIYQQERGKFCNATDQSVNQRSPMSTKFTQCIKIYD